MAKANEHDGDQRFYLDDLRVGQRFASGSHMIDAAQIKAFARQFDPQPFHLDEAAASDSVFAGLAASGWHTAALTMRLLVDGVRRDHGLEHLVVFTVLERSFEEIAGRLGSPALLGAARLREQEAAPAGVTRRPGFDRRQRALEGGRGILESAGASKQLGFPGQRFGVPRIERQRRLEAPQCTLDVPRIAVEQEASGLKPLELRIVAPRAIGMRRGGGRTISRAIDFDIAQKITRDDSRDDAR